jgi:glycerol-3-phosphate cytidylyltransferase-like family protein
MATAKKTTSKVAAKKTAAKKPAAKKTAANKTAAKKTAVKRAPSAAGNAPDAIAFLMKQHKDAKKLFKQFEKTDKKSEKERIANTVCKMLQVHTKIEEEIFYPACRQAGLDADQMDEADVEHASAKDLIAQVEGKSASDSHYDAKVKVLGEYVNHHVEEEETEMFKQARRLKLDMNMLGSEMKQRASALEIELGLTPASTMQKVGTRLSQVATRIGL